MKYNVQKSIWFNKIGIVQVKTRFSGIKYFIGTGHGANIKEDEQHIAKLGLPVSLKLIKQFFKEE